MKVVKFFKKVNIKENFINIKDVLMWEILFCVIVVKSIYIIRINNWVISILKSDFRLVFLMFGEYFISLF